MSIRAYGKNAAIELFEHHLVITRRKPGMIADGPSAERLIPFSSIKSVEFVRPGLMAHGRIILTLSGDNSNGCIVAFSKGQARQFEDVLDEVRRAIAAPSIERLAMAASQTSRPIEKSAPSANAAHQEVIVAKQSEYSEDGGQTYDRATSYDDRSFASRQRSEHRPISPTLGGWWSDMPLLGKVIACCFVGFVLFSVLDSGQPTSASGSTDDFPSSEDGSTLSSEQVLRELTEFITGRPGSTDIAITDGTGKVGEFCSSSSGGTVLSFGGTNLDGQKTGVYDYFYAYRSEDGGSSTSGTFTFDRAAGRIAITGVKESSKGSKAEPQPDMSFNLSQISPGVVDVSGVTFHSCII
ncbi:hypothetical protein [Novosphingobium sp. B1]|uniref:hypothetical protein n=1 Tax=Novosphingobium sp. B1 TaxID=1938756 RepID=UPI0009D89BA4|nr:hypothetical protein [Novosphingobium sp. B1]SMC82659.1 hypothetical protein SAMN06272759_1081 [Novosphingobium sp. B1]